MALIDRGDEESQIKEAEGPILEGIQERSNLVNILKIVFGVIAVLFVVGVFLYPKVSTYGTLYIDNPTEDNITVKVGDTAQIELKANSFQEIELKPGKYSLTVNEESVGEITKNAMDGKAFLNPTKSKYIKEEAIYMVDETTQVPDTDKTIEIDGKEFIGPFTIYDDYYIVGDWDFGIDDVLPDEVDLNSFDKKDYTIRKKIYRNKDFIEMYNLYYYSE